jgi:hypothetical protein
LSSCSRNLGRNSSTRRRGAPGVFKQEDAQGAAVAGAEAFDFGALAENAPCQWDTPEIADIFAGEEGEDDNDDGQGPEYEELMAEALGELDSMLPLIMPTNGTWKARLASYIITELT